MAGLRTEETRDVILVLITAAGLLGAQAGQTLDQVAADAAEFARQAFDLVEKGLKDYAVRA
ncbi:hypothetical protein [Streptomyces sp. NPDC052107]|uniref:hypothetical protein n=1 Tax=Streptomyces sp. NPDC052107 TaxID=3155632 RepID=UPI00342CFA98